MAKKSAPEQIDSVYDVVLKLLTDLPHLRDDDYKLVANVWCMELGGSKKVAELNGFELLAIISAGDKLTSSDSITRARRKVQEENPSLRGKTYLKRQGLQKQVRELLR